MKKYVRIDKDFGDETDCLEKIYFKGCNINDDIRYILNNSLYKNLEKFIIENRENIKRICSDIDHNVYILLNNGKLFINDKKQNIYDLVDIVYIDKLDILGITSDNKIITIKGIDEINKITNKDIPYKKIIVSSGEIVSLTEDGYLVFQVYNPGLYDSRDLMNIDDIKLDNDEFYLLKKDKWIRL